MQGRERVYRILQLPTRFDCYDSVKVILQGLRDRLRFRISPRDNGKISGAYLVACLLCLFTPSAAASFEACVSDLKAQATSEAFPAEAIASVFAAIEELPRVVAADRKQAEFIQSFGTYYNKRVTASRIERGRALLEEHSSLLAEVQAQTGLPPQYIVSFWGLETNFGSYFGKLEIPSAIATLACEGRRAKFFTQQLFALVQLVGEGHMTVDQLKGSWAGAMGHMQFMPTTYLNHAVDADGDGRKDVYGSLADALTSGGNYLKSSGWEPGFRWGREIDLPADFPYEESGMHNWQPLKFWAAMGIKDTFGKPLPALETQSAVLLPSGHSGPAFVVYPNFKVIMKWNRSTHYALSVGRLADRIAGAGRLARSLPTDDDLGISPDDLREIQTRLNQSGYDVGKVDGILGSGTQRAIQAFEHRAGLLADGFPDQKLLVALRGNE